MTDQAKHFQFSLVSDILAVMARQRINGRELCCLAGISTAHWSEMKNLKKSISIEALLKIADALHMKLEINIHPK